MIRWVIPLAGAFIAFLKISFRLGRDLVLSLNDDWFSRKDAKIILNNPSSYFLNLAPLRLCVRFYLKNFRESKI
jgi:hypothetical protein